MEMDHQMSVLLKIGMFIARLAEDIIFLRKATTT